MNYILLNICIVIILIIVIICKYANNCKNTNEMLKINGWVLYLLDSCPHCKTQLEDLFTYKDFIIYNKNGEIISNPSNLDNIIPFNKIKSFPMWYNKLTNEKKYGVQDIKALNN